MSKANPLEMHLKYPYFLKEVSKDLGLSSEEQRLAASVRPDAWALWGVANLAGDELTPYIRQEDAEQWKVPLFADIAEQRGMPVLDLQAGTLAQRLRAMYASKNPAVRTRFEHLSDQVAGWTFMVGAVTGLASKEWRSFMPQVPQAMVNINTEGKPEVQFPPDGIVSSRIDGPIDTIMNFGPGLTGAAQASVLTGHTKTIHAVSGGMGATYVNRWIDYNVQSMHAGAETLRRAGKLQDLLPPGADARTARLPEIRYHADGIAAAVGILTAKTSLDVVLMSSVHTAGVTECHAGVRGAAQYLREGGLFVLKAPDVSLGNEAGMDRVAEYAAERFGDPIAQGACGTLQQHFDFEQPIERSASFAIFQRQ